MAKIDDMIENALSEEDHELRETLEQEPGYFRQVFGIFRGRLGWVMWLVSVVQLLFFVAAIYAFWQLLQVDDALAGLRWGVASVVFVQVMTFLRGFMGTHFEVNRVLRDIQRLELRLARMEKAE